MKIRHRNERAADTSSAVAAIEARPRFPMGALTEELGAADSSDAYVHNPVLIDLDLQARPGIVVVGCG
jgi:hypothetical protein